MTEAPSEAKWLNFDPLDSEFDKNFYPLMQSMRENCRAYRHKDTLVPVVSFFRYSDILPMLKNWQEWSSERSEELKARGLGVATIMLSNDPPLHTKYRKIMAPFFKPRSVARIEQMIEHEIDRAMDRCLDNGEVDFVSDFAQQITTGLICQICGIPDADREFILSGSAKVAEHYGKGLFWKERQPEIEQNIAKVSWEFAAYFAEHVETLQRTDAKNILSEMAEQLDNKAEIVSMCALLLASGTETTANVITHGLLELIRHPAQFALLRGQPELLDSAIEEIVRFRATLRRHERVAKSAVTIDGVEISAGDSIVLWNASANRDPDFIENPEEFKIDRHPNNHIGYGHGIHSCVGNVLARAELRLTFGRLLKTTRSIDEMRGDASYESAGNGVMDVARRYSVRLSS
ncbi:MAG: cytochrome P450 [Sphingorhabdus sp.]